MIHNSRRRALKIEHLLRIKSRSTTSLSTTSSKTADAITLELKKSAHNYHPIPVVLNRGSGVFVWDIDGKVRHRAESSLSLHTLSLIEYDII